MSNVPQGWHDDGTTLTAPNGHKVKLGFRRHILSNNWDPQNMPLEEEVGLSQLEESNPSLGSGTQQVFNWTTLEWTPSRGVFVAWTGQELLKVRADKAALQTQLADLQTKLATLQSTQPAQSPTPAPPLHAS